jgi:uncharacterized protein (DUF885 family)
MMRDTLRLGFSALVLMGCAANRGVESSSRPGESFSDAYLHANFAFNPGAGAEAGLHEYDGRVIDLSAPAIARHLADFKSLRDRAANEIAHAPDDEARLRLRAVMAAIDNEIIRIDEFRTYSRNPMRYADAIDASIYAKRDFAPKPERMRSAISLLRGTRSLVNDAHANLDRVLPRVFIETAIKIAEGQAEFAEGDLLKAFEDVKDPSLQATLKSAAADAAKAMREYVAWLKSDKLPLASGDFALGRDAFARYLQKTELISQTPEEVLAIGLKELARQKAAFEAAAREIDSTKPVSEVWEALQHDHPTPQTLIPDTKAHLAQIRAFLVDRRLISFPTPEEVIVDETPTFLRATSFASMDTPGVFEKKARESFYYVTPPDASWDAKKTEEWLTSFNYYTTDVVSIHEALPGHFVQALHLLASDVQGAPRYVGSYAFIEGWAHYCEQMALDEGFPPASLAKDPKARAKYRMAQASEALLRVCRLVAAIRLHCQGQSIDEATKFFTENCYYPEQPARAEAERGTYDPGYCLYTVGKLQMFKLREDWRKQEGSAFSLRRFHDEVLKHGQPPVRLLRERMLKDAVTWDQTLGR